MNKENQSIEEKIKQAVRQAKEEDSAAMIASATALPGALQDVFSVQPDIKVGKYSIRPFFDADFEWLQALGHPFAAFAIGDTKNLTEFVPRGPHAWQLFLLLTRTPTDVDNLFIESGAERFKAEAKKEFGGYQLGALFKLYEACVKQLAIYASSVIQYSPAEDKSASKEDANVSPK